MYTCEKLRTLRTTNRLRTLWQASYSMVRITNRFQPRRLMIAPVWHNPGYNPAFGSIQVPVNARF
jgi:hypothetical protein